MYTGIKLNLNSVTDMLKGTFCQLKQFLWHFFRPKLTQSLAVNPKHKGHILLQFTHAFVTMCSDFEVITLVPGTKVITLQNSTHFEKHMYKWQVATRL